MTPWGDEALTGEQAIRRLFDEGAVHHGRCVLLIERQAADGPRRVLFVASRRVGGAVRRNRAKRLMRAAYQGIAPQLVSRPAHIAWIARSSCAAAAMIDVRVDMEGLATRAGLFAQRPAATSSDRPPVRESLDS
jgi:ribonuclease P protein component